MAGENLLPADADGDGHLKYLEKSIADLEKRMETIFQEQRHQLELADRTREATADAVRESLAAQVSEGDEHLRRHITEQIEAVRAALAAQEKLGDEKDARIQVMHEAAQRAIDKAETDVNRRLDQLNHVRQALLDQTATFVTRDLVDEKLSAAQNEREALRFQVAKLEAMINEKYLQREVFESSLSEWQNWRGGIVDQMSRQKGAVEVQTQAEGKQAITTQQIIGWIGLVVATISVVAAILVGSFT